VAEFFKRGTNAGQKRLICNYLLNLYHDGIKKHFPERSHSADGAFGIDPHVAQIFKIVSRGKKPQYYFSDL
jgi:hypothetical protein